MTDMQTQDTQFCQDKGGGHLKIYFFNGSEAFIGVGEAVEHPDC